MISGVYSKIWVVRVPLKRWKSTPLTLPVGFSGFGFYMYVLAEQLGFTNNFRKTTTRRMSMSTTSLYGLNLLRFV